MQSDDREWMRKASMAECAREYGEKVRATGIIPAWGDGLSVGRHG